MPAQPPVREPEEEMEAAESQLPEANGELEEPRENEEGGVGGEDTMEESTEERDSDLEESEEEEEEESSGRVSCAAGLVVVVSPCSLTVCTVSASVCEEMDDEDCERRRGECLHEMLDLEKQFQELKEK